MTDEEAMRVFQAMARSNPDAVLRLIENMAKTDSEMAEMLVAARRARDEADRRGISPDQVVAEWMLPAERYRPKS